MGGPFTAGGIFGSESVDHEMLDALEMDNTVSQNEVSDLIRRRTVVQKRATMLLVERLVDEWPETVSWTRERVRMAIIKRLAADLADANPPAYVPSVFSSNTTANGFPFAEPEPITVRDAAQIAAKRASDRAVETAAKFLGRVLYHTYASHDVAKAEAVRRLVGDVPQGEAALRWAEERAEAAMNRWMKMWGRDAKSEPESVGP